MKKHNIIFPFLLAVIAVFSHINWFSPSSIINFSDWLYFPDDTVSELWKTWSTWASYWNLGTANIQIYFYPFKLIWSMIVNLGFNYEIATKLTFFVPISILGFLSPYILGRKIFNNDSTAFAMSLFYGSTTYFLVKQISHIPIAFVYALVPLLIFLFMRALETKIMKFWILFTLAFSISTWYEARITILAGAILTFYLSFFHLSELRNQIKNISISIVIFIALNLFWILPTAFSSVSSEIGVIVNRGVFGNFLFDLHHAFTLTESSWTGGSPNMQFIKQDVPWHHWLIPVIAFLPLLFFKYFTENTKKRIVFFLCITLIGILLTKQAAFPFSKLYLFLYNNLPLFNIYREASKFYLLTSIGYWGLLGFSIEYTEKALSKKYASSFFLKNISICFVVLLSLINLYPLFTSSIGATFKSNPIPSQFEEINRSISSDKSFSRNLCIGEGCTYLNFGPIHPRITLYDLANLDKENKLPLFDENDVDSYFDYFSSTSVKKIMYVTSVKQIVILINPNLGENTASLISKKLEKIQYFSKSQRSNSQLLIYEVHNYGEHLHFSPRLNWSPNQGFNYDNPTPYKYKIYFPSNYNTGFINLANAYHSDWKLKVGKFNWLQSLIQNDYYYPDKYHIKSDVGLNSWQIDPQWLKDNGYVDANIPMTLYFAPQAWMNLGLIISSTTFITLLISLSYFLYKDYVKRKKK